MSTAVRTCALSFVLALALVSCESAPSAPYVQDTEIKGKQLNNNFSYLVIPAQWGEEISVQLLVEAGSIHETAPGTSRLAAFLPYKGMSSRDELKVGYHTVARSVVADSAADLDAILEELLRWASAEVPREPWPEIPEPEDILGLPLDYMHEVALPALLEGSRYLEHPFYRLPSPLPSHEEVAHFRKEYYLARRMTLLVTGAMEIESTDKLIAEAFASYPDSKSSTKIKKPFRIPLTDNAAYRVGGNDSGIFSLFLHHAVSRFPLPERSLQRTGDLLFADVLQTRLAEAFPSLRVSFESFLPSSHFTVLYLHDSESLAASVSELSRFLHELEEKGFSEEDLNGARYRLSLQLRKDIDDSYSRTPEFVGRESLDYLTKGLEIPNPDLRKDAFLRDLSALSLADLQSCMSALISAPSRVITAASGSLTEDDLRTLF